MFARQTRPLDRVLSELQHALATSLGATERTNMATEDVQHGGFSRLAGRLG